MFLKTQFRSLITLASVALGLAVGSAHADLIGPGPDITDANDQDTPGGDRLNVDRTVFLELEAGTYKVSNWRLNVFDHTEDGTITPMLLSGTPAAYTAEWIGSAFDPTSDNIQTVAESGTFTLAATTDIYAGFFTSSLGSGILALDANNSGTGSSVTAHDITPEPPTVAGDTVTGISHANLARTYAFDINVDAIPEPSSLALIALGGAVMLLRRKSNCSPPDIKA